MYSKLLLGGRMYYTSYRLWASCTSSYEADQPALQVLLQIIVPPEMVPVELMISFKSSYMNNSSIIQTFALQTQQYQQFAISQRCVFCIM